MAMQSLSNRQARRIALKAQGFLPQRRNLKRPDQRHLASIFDSIGLLQIDSVNVLDRAHYLTLFARLGAYDRNLIDRAAHAVTPPSKPKDYFEYWGHEASILPVALYPALKWRMEDAARHQGLWRGIGRFARENPERVEAVYRQIEQHGPIGVSALDKERRGKGAWWGWSDTKIALEFLFWSGRITSAGRQTFARLYDIPERVLPEQILAQGTLPAADAKRQLIEIGARSHGVGTEACLRDYFRLSPKDSKQAIAELVESGILEPVEVEGFSKQAYLHKDAAIPARATCQALLAPFDSLIFMRDRAQSLFNFHYRIEIYVPKEKRQFGYYVLPFLLGDQLVARLDLKANRQESILEVFASHAEPKIDQGKVSKALAAELEMMAQWMDLSDIRVHPKGDLVATLGQAVAAV